MHAPRELEVGYRIQGCGAVVIAFSTILSVLLSMPVCYGEAQDDERVERLANIAYAISYVSETRDDAAGLLTIGTAESGWCEDVHAGIRRGWAGVGLWQLEPASRRTPPFSGTDLDSTIHAAGEALWLWRHSFQYGRDPAARFRAYGAQAATWGGGKPRANLFWSIYQKLGKFFLAEPYYYYA